MKKINCIGQTNGPIAIHIRIEIDRCLHAGNGLQCGDNIHQIDVAVTVDVALFVFYPIETFAENSLGVPILNHVNIDIIGFVDIGER